MRIGTYFGLLHVYVCMCMSFFCVCVCMCVLETVRVSEEERERDKKDRRRWILICVYEDECQNKENPLESGITSQLELFM